jgi:hypothetical protein
MAMLARNDVTQFFLTGVLVLQAFAFAGLWFVHPQAVRLFSALALMLVVPPLWLAAAPLPPRRSLPFYAKCLVSMILVIVAITLAVLAFQSSV